MRIYRDVELVESLGSGIPRILRAYGEDCFKFTDNFIRITFPISTSDHASDHASDDYFRTDYLIPAINNGYIELTIPDKPNSQNQKYRLTAKGMALKKTLKNSK